MRTDTDFTVGKLYNYFFGLTNQQQKELKFKVKKKEINFILIVGKMHGKIT